MHQRQAIREAVAAQLAFKTAAVDRVFKTREVTWKRLELPGIAIYALEESSESANSIQRDLRRTLSLAVLAVVSLTESVDDALDAVALEIENAIDADPTFGGAAFDVVLASTHVEVTEEQGRPLGCVRLTYDVRYFTSAAPHGA